MDAVGGLHIDWQQNGSGNTGTLTVKRGDEVVAKDQGNLNRESFRVKMAKRIVEAVPSVTEDAIKQRLVELSEQPPPQPTHDDPDDTDDESLCARLLAEYDALTAKRLKRMPAGVVAAAEAMLDDERLIDRVAGDINAVGIAGETTLGVTIYALNVSRLLAKPVAGVIQGASSSGKSHVIDCVSTMFPREAVVRATDLSPQALVYMKCGELMHRAVVVGEKSKAQDDQGSDNTRMLREMISSGVLRKRVAVAAGGVPETIEIYQPGPISYIESTTMVQLDDEDQNRCLLLSTDESPTQTELVVDWIARAATGVTTNPSDVIAVHHAVQRLLKRVNVVIPFAPQIAAAMPCDRTEARRAISHIFTMVQAIALLHQRQRASGRLLHGATIEASLTDYVIARALLVDPLGRALGGSLPTAVYNFGRTLIKRYQYGEFTSTQAARDCKKAKSKVNAYLDALELAGCAERTVESSGSKPATWRITTEPPEPGSSWLPTLDELKGDADAG